MKSLKKHLFLAVATIICVSTNLLAQERTKPLNQPEGLKIGQIIKNITALDVKNNPYSLDDALKNGPVVLVFIRGQWCPVCNRYLSAIQDSLKYIYNKGATIVVVSPEKPEFIEKTIEKTGAEFTVIYDEGQKISDYFDVTFNPSLKTKIIYNTFAGAKLKKTHTDNSERLPVPATYIINKDKKIVWRHFDRDYSKRASVVEILKELDKI